MDAPEGSSYQMRDLMLQTDNYVEIGLGHAHPVNDRLTLGGKLKVLLGAGSARDAHRPDECGHEPEQMGG